MFPAELADERRDVLIDLFPAELADERRDVLVDCFPLNPQMSAESD